MVTIKTIKDYYEDMYELFPEVPKEDIQKILNYYWKALYLHNSYGGDVLIQNKNLWCFIGTLRNNSLQHFKYYIQKLTVKLRVLYKRKQIPWNGYYYFALGDAQYKAYEDQKNGKGRKRKKFKYGNVMLYKLLDECKIQQHNLKYIFKVPMGIDFGYRLYKTDFESKEAELIITRKPQTFKDILVANNNYEFL